MSQGVTELLDQQRSICAHIVTQHGGPINVESRPAQGSTFRVALPFLPAA